MTTYGACKKMGCTCRWYTKSILTPGLCKNCNHLKDQHVIPSTELLEDNDISNEDIEAFRSLRASSNRNSATIFEHNSFAQSHTNHENDKSHKRRKSANVSKISSDNYTKQILKKKRNNLMNHNDSIWKKKYEKSQQEVEHWQKKYNELYIKYKDLLAKYDEKEQNNNNEDSKSETETETQSKYQTQTVDTQTNKEIDRENLLLIGNTNNNSHQKNNQLIDLITAPNVNSQNQTENIFADWTTF